MNQHLMALMPDKRMIEAGQRVASELYDANLDYILHPEGFDQSTYTYPEIVDAYVHGEINRVTAIWLAMQLEAQKIQKEVYELLHN